MVSMTMPMMNMSLAVKMLLINRYFCANVTEYVSSSRIINIEITCNSTQAPTGSSDEHDALQQRRDLLHRKLETLQQRQTRRSDNLTEKFQRGLSVRRQ